MSGRRSAPLLLPAAERMALPWKNGGGLTREIASHPPGSDLSSFEWRVSIAEVRGRSSFSSFPGVDRCLAVLEGKLVLMRENHPTVHLTPASAPFEFVGEMPVLAEPEAEVATDLNVMTRRGRFSAQMRRHELTTGAVALATEATTLIVARTALRLRALSEEWILGPEDAALIEEPLHCELLAAGRAGAYFLIEFRAQGRVTEGPG
jgi:uncharacterized protein